MIKRHFYQLLITNQMPHDLLLTTEIDILVLLLVACLAAIAFKRIKFPYTVGLVIVGLILSGLASQIEALEIVNPPSARQNVVLSSGGKINNQSSKK